MANHGGRVGRRQAVASVLLAAQIAACSSWRVENVPPAQLLVTNHPSEVRVTRADSSTVVLHTPGVVGDSLWGWSRGAQLAVPLTDVRAIATRHGDVGKSFLLGVGIVGGVFAIAAVACVSGGCVPLGK